MSLIIPNSARSIVNGDTVSSPRHWGRTKRTTASIISIFLSHQSRWDDTEPFALRFRRLMPVFLAGIARFVVDMVRWLSKGSVSELGWTCLLVGCAGWLFWDTIVTMDTHGFVKSVYTTQVLEYIFLGIRWILFGRTGWYSSSCVLVWFCIIIRTGGSRPEIIYPQYRMWVALLQPPSSAFRC